MGAEELNAWMRRVGLGRGLRTAPNSRGRRLVLDKTSQYTKISIMTDGEWSVVFWVEDSGSRPVNQFLDSLDAKTQTRFIWSIEQLRARNIRAREPLVRQLVVNLWELRGESRTDIYRLTYGFVSGRRILFMHRFQKNGQKTPWQEIVFAQRRLDRFVEREGGE